MAPLPSVAAALDERFRGQIEPARPETPLQRLFAEHAIEVARRFEAALETQVDGGKGVSDAQAELPHRLVTAAILPRLVPARESE